MLVVLSIILQKYHFFSYFFVSFSFSVKTVCESDIIIIFILRFQRSY